MHAVFLTFEFAGESDELTQAFTGFADNVTDLSGLVTQTWLKDGSTIGGFYVFRSSDDAEQFLNAPCTRGLASHPCVSDFYIRHFSTIGAIGTALPVSTAALRPSSALDGDACLIWQPELDHISAQTV